MSALAAIRPGEWELPLFVHVLGALALIGALALTAALLAPALRRGRAEDLRLVLRSLTLGVIPAYLVMRVGAEWIAAKQGWNDLDSPPSWIDIGYIAADGGALLILVTTLLAWRTYRRSDAGGPGTKVRVAAGLIALLLVLNVVALWAMTVKPG